MFRQMPVSDMYHAIFLHNPKTGGSTIQLLLEIPQPLINLAYIQPGSTGMLVSIHHLTYRLIQQVVPPVKFQTYFKFTYVRNPWDRVVSTYHYDRRGFKRFDDFVDFIDWLYQNYDDTTIFDFPKFEPYLCFHLLRQHLFTGPDVMVYRFENFATDTADLLGRLGINTDIPKINTSEHRHYSHYYTDRTRDIIARVYADDIRQFNYTFEQGPRSCNLI
jgi:hypothetical protein